ncbi:MAG: hypothetical protein M3N23_07180 [Pseudomonadota bacterium]|nr:hypothetical protein [Pseudomonadota bacterium]
MAASRQRMVRMRSGWLRRWLAALTTPPFSRDLPIDLHPLHGKSTLSLLWRRTRPWLTLLLARQGGLIRSDIPANARRILWIYKGTPQVGDALMDLSSRVMLRGRVEVDLLTDPHLAQLFAADEIFQRVLSDSAQLKVDDYDLVIADSYKARCLRAKLQLLRRVPVVTMRGYFSGPEFNRTLFSFYRMQQLLGDTSLPLPDVMRPALFATETDAHIAARLPIVPHAVAFAIGGVAPERTYAHWDAVIAAWQQVQPGAQVILLGSPNGRRDADQIAASVAPGAALIDCVGKHSLCETFEIVRRCRAMVCCDGGLLHVALAAGVPVLALFDAAVAPAMRLVGADATRAIQSAGSVSAISPQQVLVGLRVMMAAQPSPAS